MRTGRLVVSPASHSTATSRSRSSTFLATVRQSRAWTVRPRPRVMKPTMLSPGTGAQHLANRTSRSSTPLIRTAGPSPALRAVLAVLASATAPGWGAPRGRRWCPPRRRREFAHHLLERLLAIPDGGEQVVRRREPQLADDLLHLVGGEQARRRQPGLSGLALAWV